MNRKSFIKGAATLGVAGILVKAIGILYRIPLANLLGTEGSALYQTAYPFYTVLLMLSTAGLPPVISKLVSQHIALGDRAGAKKIFRVALVLLATLGLVFAIALFLFSETLAIMVKDPLASITIAYIAPAILFVAVMSAIRGYFQGLQNMFPTAMTQVIEQVVKVGMGLTLAYVMLPKGVEYAAAGAILGVVISEFIALCVITVYYFLRREKVPKDEVSSQSVGNILKKIITLAIPILIGASIMPIVSLSDTIIIRARLMTIGYTLESARSLFGIFSFYVNTLVNVPGTISLAFCVSILPVISSAHSNGQIDAIKNNTKIGFKMAMLVGLPSAVGLAILSTPIIDLLYGSKLTINEVALAGQLLSIIAGGVIFLSILQTLNGVLQGLGKVIVPVIALGSGAVIKIILGYILIGTPSINIYGAPISTFSCYLVAAIIDIVIVKKLTGVHFGFRECLLRPALASIFMGAAAWGSYALLSSIINTSFATIIAVLVGVVIFVLCIPIFGVLSRSEILGLPSGSRMIKGYDKLSRKIG
ncbi:MAG: polysaccharide biosynthesis protein [Clostridiales bacterium]|nr:polysaccharide biosynthesis protein [Clostridiales bacterium]